MNSSFQIIPLLRRRHCGSVLFDKDGNAISDSVAISTYDSCEQNFMIVNFSEAYLIANGLKTFLPLVAFDI